MPHANEVQRQDPSASPPLVAVRGLRETVAAGFGNAMLVVRTLDDVSLSVRSGDLVLVSGAAGAGAASLVATLAGRRRISHGSRELSPGARVRRGVVTPDARDAIVAGWTSNADGLTSPYRHASTPTAYLLRVRSAIATTASSNGSTLPGRGRADDEQRDAGKDMTESWKSWAGALRKAGGAIVLWESGVKQNHVPGAQAAVAFRRVREEGVRERPVREGRVRVLTLVAGRIAADCVISDAGH
jgi:hypothetical protein